MNPPPHDRPRRPISAVLFDLDGTLVDSASDIASAANHVLVDLGVPPRTVEEVRGFIGDGVHQLMARCIAGRLPTHPVTTDDLVRRFQQHYEACALETTRPYPGIVEILPRLPRALAVVSNKPELFCRQILAGLALASPFSVVIGGDTLSAKKPDAAPLLAACARLGVRSDEAVMVGDAPQDMEAARAAGITAVGVAWGQATADALRSLGADTVLFAPEDLVTWLGTTTR